MDISAIKEWAHVDVWVSVSDTAVLIAIGK